MSLLRNIYVIKTGRLSPRYGVWLFVILLFLPLATPALASDANAALMKQLFEKAFGKKTKQPSQVDVDVIINGETSDKLVLFADENNQLSLIEREPLLKQLQPLLKETYFALLQKKTQDQEKLTLESLSDSDISATYNENSLSLEITIKPNLLQPKILSLQKALKQRDTADNVVSPIDTNVRLNLYNNVTVGASQQQIQTRAETIISHKDLSMHSSHTLQDNQWLDNQLTFTYDQADKLLRWQAGDTSSDSQNFQNSISMVGLKATKSFFMDRQLQIRPDADQQFILETDSTVEAYVNDKLLQRFYLRAGTFDLQDIGLSDGENNIRIKITDSFGEVSEIFSSQLFDSQLLAPDLSYYSVSLGKQDKEGSTDDLESVDDLFISGFYQWGESEDLTLGFDAHYQQEKYMMGYSLVSPLKLGTIQHGSAFSGGEDAPSGYATRLHFKPTHQIQDDNAFTSLLNSWSLTSEYRSETFVTPDQTQTPTSTEQLKSRYQYRVGLDLGKDWIGNINGYVSRYYDNSKDISNRLNLSRHFAKGIRLDLGLQHEASSDIALNAQLSLPLSDKLSSYFNEENDRLELLFNSSNETFSTQYIHEPSGNVGANSLAGSLSYIQTPNDKQTLLNTHYRHPNFETRLNLRQSINGRSEQTAAVGLDTSLLCVGSDCTVSYPVNGSFALLKGPGNQQKPIAVKKGYGQFNYDDVSDIPLNYEALIKDKGSKAIIPLESYSQQLISVDGTNMPMGYDPDKTEFSVYPRYRQAYSLQAGGKPGIVLDGVLLDKEGETLSFKGGQLSPLNDQGKTIAFFTNKVGKFRIPSVPPGRYKIELVDFPKMFYLEVEIPENTSDEQRTLNLGFTINSQE